MQSFLKHIKRYLFVFITTILVIAVVDFLLFAFLLHSTIMPRLSQAAPETVLEEITDTLVLSDGAYSLPDSQKEMLSKNNIWCILLDLDGNAIWEFDLPDEIPHEYSLQDIALMSRGYLQDYPVFIWKHGENLLIAGYPKMSYTKILPNYLQYNTVQKLPFFTISVLGLNILILFFAYYISKRSITKNISPIVDAITQLSYGEQASLSTKGDLAEISESLNRTAAILEKNDKARANWISGVSHDIRTPLSMVLGYADRIAENPAAGNEVQTQAIIIRNQSMKIKELIQDLNLVSKLEYDAQPLTLKPIVPAKLIRSLVVEYLNNGLDEKYTIETDITETGGALTANMDTGLLKRAIENLLQNCIRHNPQGCAIQIRLDSRSEKWSIAVKDNGEGVSQTALANLMNKQHYLDKTDEQTDLRHGLGLLIVRQITSAHNGIMEIESEADKGFSVTLTFPVML